MPGSTNVFPFPARRRVAGARLGISESVRRGPSADVASSRPYQPGDDMRMIDWGASARLTAIKGEDSFVVREYFAEETPVAAVVVDRSPSMLAPVPAPLLNKAEATRTAATLIADSAFAARTQCGFLDGADSAWISPNSRSSRDVIEERLRHGAAGTQTASRLVYELSKHSAEVPQGALVFVLSDFTGGGLGHSWLLAQELGWELVPVVLQDPRFEQSFPLEAAGLVLELADGPLLVDPREARRLKETHEQRTTALQAEFADADSNGIWIGSTDSAEILGAFLDWSRAFAPRRR